MNPVAHTSEESVCFSVSDDLLSVGGFITVNTLSFALKQLDEIKTPIHRLSFAGVKAADSAAIVLLLACQRRLQSERLAMCDVPDRLKRLLSLYDLSALFDDK